jgi:hypothetical protein
MSAVGACGDVAVGERVEGVAVGDGLGARFVEEEVDGRQRSLPVGRAGGSSAGRLEECVGPIAGEFAVDVPAEDFEELGAADVVEAGVQGLGAVGFLVDGGGAA